MRVPPWALAGGLAGAYLLIDPPSADLAAQTYRAQLGPSLWNNGWFAGHHTPGYSVLFPALATVLGPRVVGALAAVAATAAFTALAERRWGRAGRTAALWFAAASVTSLLSGRLTFALGTAIGLLAVLAAQRGRPAAAVGVGALTPLASPVAGLFVGLAGAAWAAAAWRAGGPARWRAAAPGAALGAAGIAPTAALAVAFPGAGTEPFVASAFWPPLALLLALAAVVPAREAALRTGLVLYAAGFVAAFALPTAVGGNVTRLGALLAGPVVAGALLAAGDRRRRLALAVLVAPLLWWQWVAPVRDVARAAGDPSVRAEYHEPLLRFLDGERVGRVEIPMTVNHWEAAHVAPHHPLARGWERQMDRHVAALLYAGRVEPERYRRWLVERGVTHVAVPDAPLDAAGRAEAALVGRRPAFLREVWRNRHWTVHRVRGTRPLAEGAGRLRRLHDDGFSLEAARPGDTLVRVHFTPHWTLTRGTGCVERAPGGWTRVRSAGAGRVEVRASFAPGRVGASGPRCRRS